MGPKVATCRRFLLFSLSFVFFFCFCVWRILVRVCSCLEAFRWIGSGCCLYFVCAKILLRAASSSFFLCRGWSCCQSQWRGRSSEHVPPARCLGCHSSLRHTYVYADVRESSLFPPHKRRRIRHKEFGKSGLELFLLVDDPLEEEENGPELRQVYA